MRLEASRDDTWHFEDKVYTYSYRNDGDALKGDQTSSPVGAGFPGITPTDIAGRVTTEDYRTVGNDARIGYSDSHGTLLLGSWIEHSWQNESRVAADLTSGLLYNANKAAHTPIYFTFGSHLDTLQPYAQYAWQATDDLTVRSGVRYRNVTRHLNAAVIQNFLPGTAGTVSRTVNSTLPSIDATYRAAANTDILAQVSKGSLVPSQTFFYTQIRPAEIRPSHRRRSPTNSVWFIKPRHTVSVSMPTTSTSTTTSQPSCATATPCT